MQLIKIFALLFLGFFGIIQYGKIEQKPTVYKTIEPSKSVTVTDCLTDLPPNIIWSEIIQRLQKCKPPKTRRKNVKSIFEFIQFVRNNDNINNALTEKELQIIKEYYKNLESCSECETIDCRYCNNLFKIYKRGRVIVREKRFSLD